MPDITITPATARDAQAILSLLERCGLPTDGLLDHLADTFVARKAGEVVGSAGLEIHPGGALLRSVAVDARARGTGLGQQLTEIALASARERGVPAAYLLTTTAQHFFPRFGFEVISRDDVPMAVKQSVEFTSACPASAIVMRKIL